MADSENSVNTPEELPTIENIEHALLRASRLPYNNAAHIFEAAGMEQDTRMGGSCLMKLRELRKSLPRNASTSILTSKVGKGNATHFAMAVDLVDGPYYLDPFLWQSEPMPLNTPGAQAHTLEDIWTLHREPDKDGVLAVVSLIQSKPAHKTLMTHEFTGQIAYLPNASTLPLSPQTPSFIMQIPDQRNQLLYKLWYSKQSGGLDNMWIVDGRTGDRRKILKDDDKGDLRQAFNSIEDLLGVAKDEIDNYFVEARKLELSLGKMMQSSSLEEPLNHGK